MPVELVRDEQPEAPPVEVLVLLQHTRRVRSEMLIPGRVSLHIDEAPGKPSVWTVCLGSMVVGRFERDLLGRMRKTA